MWNTGGPGFGKQGLQTHVLSGLGLHWGQLTSSLMSLPGGQALAVSPVHPSISHNARNITVVNK